MRRPEESCIDPPELLRSWRGLLRRGDISKTSTGNGPGTLGGMTKTTPNPVPQWLRATVAAAAMLAVLAAGSASATAAPGSHSAAITTKVLLAEVHRAYLRVPALEVSVIPGRSSIRTPRKFVLILRSGVVVAEEFTRSGRSGTTLVARRGHATYARAAGARCWRRLPSSDPRTLADVGVPFPYTRERIKALQPRRTRSGWKVLTDNRAEFWFMAVQPRPPAETSKGYRNRFITYTIGIRSHRLTSYYVQQPTKRPERTWRYATLRVTALTAAPHLPTPAPAC